MCRIFTCLLSLFVCFGLFAQENIPVRITELAELTLTESPTIQRNYLAINTAQGELRVQKSAFDYNLFSSASISRSSLNLFEMDARTPYTEGNLNTRGFVSSVGVSRMFRTGMTASLSVDYNSVTNNFVLNRFNESVGPNITDHYMTSSLSLRQPLVKGRGTAMATALEKSAALNLKSAQSNLSFANSIEVLEVSSAYWQYLTAYESAGIYKQNEARVRRMLAVTEDLVKGDKKPKGDLDQVKADLANQERQSNVAKQNLVAARLNLGRAIGLSDEESLMIGAPIDDFPTIEQSGYTRGMSLDQLREVARENRKDITANQLSQEALNLRLRLANNNRKPQLDLLGVLKYGGASMGNNLSDSWAAFTNSEGRDVGFELGLQFNFPVNNNRAQGTYAQRKAMLMDQELYTENLSRNIDLNVAIATTNLENTTEILRNAKTSLDYYQQVYENEQVKFQNGLSTLLNLIIFQERLTFAQLEYLQARQQFALAIVNLRFETGTLYAQKSLEAGNPTFTPEIFYTIPKSN